MYALTTLRAPGTLSPGYFRGDYVPDAVAQSWKLVEGEDVQADPIDDSGDTPAVPRPAFEPGGAQRTTDAAADQGNDALGA
jgi:hypothetical protein